jgi:hypothetical protein
MQIATRESRHYMSARKKRLDEIHRIISDHSSHLPEGFAAVLNERFANMMADEAWEDGDALPSLVALRAFLLMLMDRPPPRSPGVGTNGRGSIAAFWRVGNLRYTYDFLPSGRVHVFGPY